ncbi:uncharacterized protein LOC129765673 [Toxorhynchites rutilus septentrionalis]|uniref:uncharacterized protein LOC129765673 n=1 Tax=Toxorhynchites rutilus septentrionalis TaxID=329112 RepID=UPI0024784EC6|nr:uncharacterized protein LOC129765673 [Toxorhynchites rutilus septentrionalis]
MKGMAKKWREWRRMVIMMMILTRHHGSDAGSAYNLAAGVSALVSSASVPPSHSHASNSHNNSKRSNDSTRSNTKATVHINGVAVDHFQQNSDVDEDRVSMMADSGAICQNSDVQGFISYSSDSSMIELNLKFRKCACNENIMNLSKENLLERANQQKEQRSPEPPLAAHPASKDVVTGVGDAFAATTTTTTLFSKEGKSKKKLQLNKDNLNSLVNKLNDTNSSSTSGTKCRLSLDINNILNQVVSEKKITSEDKMQTEQESVEIIADSAELLVGEGYNATLEVVDEFDESHSRAASWSPLLPSPCSPSPASSVAADCSSCLQRRHSENVECRSIGIQHGLKPNYNRKKHLRRGKTQAEEIIVISDEFRRQSISDQKVKIQKAKKYSKSMEMIERKQEGNSNASGGAVECLHLEEDTLTIVVDQSVKANGHSKSKSKSVDDISLNSEHNEEEFGSLRGTNANEANSVELVFISDKFVQRKSKTDSDIIIVDINKKSLKRKRSSNKNLIIITDDYKEKTSSSVNNDVKIVKSSSLKGKDLRRKTTISNSNSFLTYEEPFSPETLENKDIGAMFAEESAAASK